MLWSIKLSAQIVYKNEKSPFVGLFLGIHSWGNVRGGVIEY